MKSFRGKTRVAMLLSILLLWSSFSVCLADDSKISPDLRGLSSNSVVDVIVQYKSIPQSTSGGGLLGGLLGGIPIVGPLLNAVVKVTLGLLNAVVYTLTMQSVRELSEDPNVIYISRDRPVGASLEFANPTTGASIAFSQGYRGAGVGVAIIDSGINNHADFKTLLLSRVVYSQSFVKGDSRTSDPYGHGTHVAGIVAGDAGLSSGLGAKNTFRGMAPAARLINLRVLDANGAGTDSAVIRAIERAISLKSKYNIRVINLSLGRPVYESFTKDPLCKAVEKAWLNGITVVVAAGNEGRNNTFGTRGYGTVMSPANHPSVITVGAMKDMGTVSRGDDLIATYSSKGPTQIDHIVKPDIVAPGNRIISLLSDNSVLRSNSGSATLVPLNYYLPTSSTRPSSDYYRLSGTSMAAPMVSGTAALMLAEEPGLKPDQVKARLMKTATKSFPA
ncbi:MAG: S8 family peptidase, partial [Bryobacteraceae bacterium]